MLLGTGTTCTGCCRPASARSAVLLGRASSSPCSTSTSLRIRQGLRMTATPEDAPQPSPSCSPRTGDEALFLFKAHLAASSADGRSLSSLPLAAAATAAALLLLASPDGSWAAEPNHLFDLAESEDFWGNVVRYGRYFVTVMLGTGYVMVRPIVGLFTKSPVSAIFATLMIVGAAVGTKVTLDAMLGLSEQVTYQSANFM